MFEKIYIYKKVSFTGTAIIFTLSINSLACSGLTDLKRDGKYRHIYLPEWWIQRDWLLWGQDHWWSSQWPCGWGDHTAQTLLYLLWRLQDHRQQRLINDAHRRRVSKKWSISKCHSVNWVSMVYQLTKGFVSLLQHFYVFFMSLGNRHTS